MARIAFFIPDMRGGGAERVAGTLIEEFVERGHEVDLVVLQARGEYMSLLPPSIRIVELHTRRFRQSIFPLVRYLRKERPDALLAFMWPMTTIAVTARLLARTKTRIVTSDHGILSEHYHKVSKTASRIKWTTRLLYPLADARVAVSQGIAADLVELSSMPRERFTVIANPIPMPPDEIQRDEQIEALWNGGSKRILTVGSLKPDKNHVLLLTAFAELVRSGDARLMIVGDGYLRDDLAAKAQELGISDLVIMPGFQSDPWPYYASADLFVLSSDTEGFGNVLVEAMAVGLPIVSTDCAGPREVLNHGEFGRLVPVGNVGALAKAMDEELRAPSPKEQVKSAARRFRPKIAADRYLKLLVDGPWS